jgi:N-acetylmuramoyl-L-alanine amidase
MRKRAPSKGTDFDRVHFSMPRRGVGKLPLLLAILMLAAPAVTLCGANDSSAPPYLSLKDVAGRLGMRLHWIEKGERQRLSSDWTELEFTLHKRECLLNGHRLHLGFPIRTEEGQPHLLINKSDWEHLLRPILTPAVHGPPPPIRHIMLDAGHGGHDHGARNDELGLIEKSLTLDLAHRLQKKLQEAGYKVSLTRSEDRFLSLEERPTLANEAAVDLFLSLHFNAATKASVEGIETFVFTPPFQPSTSRSTLDESDRQTYPGNAHNATNTLLGFYLHREIENSLPGPDRGLKRARFTVLRDIRMPGILIEGGFLSHDREGRQIGSAAYRETLCDAILEGLRTYQRTRDRLLETAHAQ